jgi:hypothetical protein
MEIDFKEQEKQAIKESYANLLATLFEQESILCNHAKCLIKWGVLLGIDPREININSKFASPKDEISKLESVYHLVHMIYLDQVVEDVELEVASIYAERLGFKNSLVGDLFKSIATAEFDLSSAEDIRKEVIDFLKIQG